MKISSKSMIAFLALAAAPSVIQAVSPVDIDPSSALVMFPPDQTPAVVDWDGAKKFCEDKLMRLAYRSEWCPDGNVYTGQKTGDHWAAILDGPNEWVQIGEWWNPPSTSNRFCETHREIGNFDPDWGTDDKACETPGSHTCMNGGATENEYILCSKAVEYTLDDLHKAKFSLELLLNSGWIYSPWGCTEQTPCVAVLDDDLRLWLGKPEPDGGYGPHFQFGGYRVWHTNSAMDTYGLLMGVEESAGNWDPAYKGTGDQRKFQMHSNDKIQRTDINKFFTRITTTNRDGGGGGVVKPDPTSYGDPHFVTWGGEAYDFHGGCELVLLENGEFGNGMGMNIHIRTNIKTWWSHIKSAAVQIGDHTLEIAAGTGSSSYWINGGDESVLESGDATLGDFPVHFKRVNDHHTSARIDLGHGDAIGIETFKDFVRVNVKDKSKTAFKRSVGLLGAYSGGGIKVGRDGKTVIKNTDEFGQEWMVRATDPLIFHDSDASQLPLVCAMPDDSSKKDHRRLGVGSISEEDASLACARVEEFHRDACIFDVMATQDKTMAGSY